MSIFDFYRKLRANKYKYALNFFESIIEKDQLFDLTNSDIDLFVAEAMNKGLKNSSISQYLTQILIVIKYYKDNKILDKTDYERLKAKIKKTQQSLTKVEMPKPGLQEVLDIPNKAEDPRTKLIVLLRGEGLTTNEIRSLKVSDAYQYIRDEKIVMSHVIAYLNDYCMNKSSNDFLISHKNNPKRPLGERSIEIALKGCIEDAGLEEQVSATKFPILYQKACLTRVHLEPIKMIQDSSEIKNLTHDDLIDMLCWIGEFIFGYQAFKKPAINDIRPKNNPINYYYKLDLAWKIGLAWIPFEIQEHGSISDIMTKRFIHVYPWSHRLVIVAEQSQHEKIMSDAKPQPFASMLKLISTVEVGKAFISTTALAKLRSSILE